MGSDFGVIRYSSDVGFSLVLSVPLCMRKSCLVSTWIQGYPGSGAGRAEWIFFQARHQLRYVDSALDTLGLIFRTANKQSHVNQIQSCSAGFQAHEGLRRLLVDLQQNWVHKPHPEFPARGPGRCGEWGWALRGAGWLSAGLPARYNCSTSQASDVLHHTVHIIASGLAFPCCILVKPKYLCLFSTQFILNGKDCCQNVKDICNTNMDLPNLDTGKVFWACRAGHMPASRISVSLLPRDTCLS